MSVRALEQRTQRYDGAGVARGGGRGTRFRRRIRLGLGLPADPPRVHLGDVDVAVPVRAGALPLVPEDLRPTARERHTLVSAPLLLTDLFHFSKAPSQFLLEGSFRSILA